MMNEFVFLKLVSVIISAFSQILLKKSAIKVYDSRIKEYLNVLVIFAYGLFFLSTVFSVFALRGISISFSTIIESFSYFLIPTLSYIFFKEKITRMQMLGIIIILIGIIVYTL